MATKSKKKAKSHYAQKFPWQAIVELGVGVYCIFGLLEYIGAQKFIIGPFLALYSVGFLSVGVLSFMHFVSNLVEMHKARIEAKKKSAKISTEEVTVL